MTKNKSTLRYSVRESVKAIRPRLRLTVQDGLVVLVPKGYDQRGIPQIIERNMSWIKRTAAGLRTEYSDSLRNGDVFIGPLGEPVWTDRMLRSLPNKLELKALDETIAVRYERTLSRDIRYDCTEPETVTIRGDTDDTDRCKTVLQGYLKKYARKTLVPWINSLAQEFACSVSHVSIRNQKTRWGSCSAAGSINLNVKVLFLPPELCRYILIHELCHTKHMNHSKAFWNSVSQCDPEYKTKDRSVRHAWRYIPPWML
jgi:predicted metal-dependent hydrolase